MPDAEALEGLKSIGISDEHAASIISGLDAEGKAMVEQLNTVEVATAWAKDAIVLFPTMRTDTKAGVNAFKKGGDATITIDVQKRVRTSIDRNGGLTQSQEEIFTIIKHKAAEPALRQTFEEANRLGPSASSDRMNELKSSSKIIDFMNSKGFKYFLGSSLIFAMWEFGGKQDLDDAVNVLGNALEDVAKSLIGAFKSVADELIKAGNSSTRLIIIIAGILAGVALLGIGIYYGVKEAKKRRARR